MGAPGQGQDLMFVVTQAVAFSAKAAVLEGVGVGDVGPRPGFELREFVGCVGGGAKERAEERLQVGLVSVGGTGAVVEAFMCSSWWHR